MIPIGFPLTTRIWDITRVLVRGRVESGLSGEIRVAALRLQLVCSIRGKKQHFQLNNVNFRANALSDCYAVC